MTEQTPTTPSEALSGPQGAVDGSGGDRDPRSAPEAAGGRTALRERIAEALWEAAEADIIAEWICCEPLDPTHQLCAQGYAAMRMIKALIVDDPNAWKPAPLADAVLAVVQPQLDRLAATLAEALDTYEQYGRAYYPDRHARYRATLQPAATEATDGPRIPDHQVNEEQPADDPDLTERGPRPLSDAELIAWSVILQRRHQQTARGITILRTPLPPCPTCQQPVTETATAEQFGQGRLMVQPCGHGHTFHVGDVYRLTDHIGEMLDLLEQADRGPAGEHGWTTAAIVREARVRTGAPAATEATEPATITEPAWLREQYTSAMLRVIEPFRILIKPEVFRIVDELAGAVMGVRDRHLEQLRQRLRLADELHDAGPTVAGEHP